KATTPTERTVCANPGLAAIDRKLDAAYKSALANATDDRALRQSQREWVRDFQLCDEDPFCIEESYADRIAVLDSFSGDSSAADEPEPVEAQATDASPIPTATPVERAPRPAAASPEPKAAETVGDVQRKTQGNPLVALTGGGLVLGMILAVVAALAATKALADHTTNKYGWPLIMNWWNLLHFVGAVAGMFVASFGGIVMGLVVFAGCWLVVLIVNIAKTNLLTGLAMTIIQPLVVAILWVIYGVTKDKAEGRRI
ncbi:MAG TPA: lysozyme inhibitor LprI family protein, partial [Caulobacteraceae bacterium]|nr:lysozyme inhibitor LprI family protein [Caulobacteraceae bacterium]